jgi:predicted DsbA family dithiol-disulfide isomerase
MALQVTAFSDFICPFCYIGFRTIQKVKPEFDLDIRWRGYQIHPDWPAEGMDPSNFYGSGAAADQRRRAIWERILAMADEIGLQMTPPAILTNSRHALEAAEYAAEKGLTERFDERLFSAYFQEGANIGKPEVVADLAREIGIDPHELSEAIASRKYSLLLKNSEMIAHQRGVSGVPTFFVGDFPMVGAQSTDVMRKIFRRASEKLATQ